MQVTVLLFASYADALGARSLALELPDAARAADVVRLLRERPGADALPPAPLVAINERYAAEGTLLRDRDVVAVLPPVAGG
jgi:molybdopterin converting factor small subunit